MTSKTKTTKKIQGELRWFFFVSWRQDIKRKLECLLQGAFFIFLHDSGFWGKRRRWGDFGRRWENLLKKSKVAKPLWKTLGSELRKTMISEDATDDTEAYDKEDIRRRPKVFGKECYTSSSFDQICTKNDTKLLLRQLNPGNFSPPAGALMPGGPWGKSLLKNKKGVNDAEPNQIKGQVFRQKNALWNGLESDLRNWP